jgi:hypothetical protein
MYVIFNFGVFRVPAKNKEDPGYVYQPAPVRKKEERRQLPGWECHECKTVSFVRLRRLFL